LLLESVLRYFSIFKVYANAVHTRVEGGWPTMVKFLTHVAREMQTNIYGKRWQVHPLHRTLIAEVIMERVTGVRCWHVIPGWETLPPPPQERVRLSLELCQDRPNNHSLMEEHQVLFGDLERSFSSFSDRDDAGRRYLEAWFQQTRDAIMDAPRSNTPASGHHDVNHERLNNNLNSIERERIRAGLFPWVWMFRDGFGQPIESAIGFGGKHGNQIEIRSWSSHVYENEARIVPGRKFWNVGQACDARDIVYSDDRDATKVRSVVDMFCLGMGSDGANGMEFVLSRFAWVVAHRIHPVLSKLDGSRWEEIVEGAAHELEDWEQDYALAAIRRQILLATASDYL